MNFTALDLTVVIIYLVSMLALGLYQARKIKNTGDYFAGGRGFNKFLMMMHALGTGTHADDPVGVVGATYKHGFAGIWYTFVYLFVTPFYWIMAPLFRRARFFTTADFFEARFGKSLGLLYSVMGILTFAVNMGTLLKGTGLITSAITQGQMPEWVAILGMTGVFLIYGTLGGLIATVVTESVQGLLIVVMSVLLVPFGLSAVGGFAGLHQLVESSKFSLHASASMAEVTIPWIIAGTIMSLIGIVSQPHTMEVCSTGKTEFEGRVGFTYGNFVKRFCAIAWAFSGMVVIAMVANGQLAPLGENREAAFGTAIRALLPSGFTGLMFAAILAAQMSTLSAFMVAASALLSRNIYKRYINTAATDRQVLGIARFAGLLIVLLGLLFAFWVDSVADALVFFWGLSTLTGVFMWAGVLWKRTNSAGAWVSFIVMATIWTIVGPIGAKLHEAYFANVAWLGIYGEKKDLAWMVLSYLPAGVVTLIVVSFLTKPLPKTILDKFYLLLKTPVGQEDKLIEAGVDVVYAGATKPHPWETKYPVLVNVGGFFIALIVAFLFLGLLYLVSRLGA
ncbi:MAG: sodium:solute symporter family protein [Armatimonadota bacterium]|nr:sodium:solute symporter family protein [Armatimonadota bacterium]